MTAPRALLVGGTGPSGPHVLGGLVERGFDVTMFHTGRHEVEGAPDVPHVHGDPFTADGIAEAVGTQDWDLVVATYGRVRLIAEQVADRCRQFLFVGGTPVYRGMVYPGDLDPPGLRMPVREDHVRVDPQDPPGRDYGVGAIRRTEDAVFGLGERGAFAPTVFRYPTIYGPRNPHPWEWTVVRRVLDGRPFVFVPDDGRGTHSRCGHRNAAHAFLLAVDHPDAAAGNAYNVADDEAVSMRQWVEVVATLAGGGIEVRSLPGEIPQAGWGMIAFGYRGTPNCIVDTTAIRGDLGYADVQSLEDGIRETIEPMLARPEDFVDHAQNVDPFDYEAEDRVMAVWERSLAELQDAAAPIASGLAHMPTPQTASASGANR